MRRSNYDKFPFIAVPDSANACVMGWDAIADRLRQVVANRATRKLFAFSIVYLFALFAILLLEVVVKAILPLVW